MSDLLPLFEEQRVEVNTWPDRPRYLMSYAYKNDEQIALCVKHGVDLVVDSGAFTTASSGKQMDHDAYLDWLITHKDALTFALSYDVIGDHEASRRNHEIAEDRVGDLVTLLPTFHLGSPMEELERLCRSYDFISIGGAVPFALQVRHLNATLGHIHTVAAEHGTRLHGLGMTGNRIIHKFPWWSVDSSRWTSVCRFPRIALAAQDGRIHEFRHGQELGSRERGLVHTYGGDPSIMTTPGWSLASKVGAEVALERRRWGLHSAARSLMYAEAHKRSHGAPLRIYLSGTAPLPEGAVGLILAAHEAGNPWTTTPERNPA